MLKPGNIFKTRNKVPCISQLKNVFKNNEEESHLGTAQIGKSFRNEIDTKATSHLQPESSNKWN